MRYGLGSYLRLFQCAAGRIGELITLYPPFTATSLRQCDLIHLHDAYLRQWFDQVAVVAKQLGIPIVSHIHYFHRPPELDYICANSKCVFVSELQRKTYGVMNSFVLHNHIIITHRREYPRVFNFMFAGRFDAMKGIDWVIKNVGKHRWALAGFEERIEAKNAVVFGYVGKEMLYDLMAMSEIFVLPSRFDPFGTVVLEAALQGAIPAVSKNVGAIEVLPREYVIIFNPNNTTADDIYEEYISRELYKYRKELSEYIAENLNEEKYAEKLATLYSYVL